ncbi:hypothetical protein AD14_1326 [Escherichia coli 3-073-06_S4_C2]|nr:hypothetical protein AD14_1326 [Escherichia coli 3-073-06_S4_C2]
MFSEAVYPRWRGEHVINTYFALSKAVYPRWRGEHTKHT